MIWIRNILLALFSLLIFVSCGEREVVDYKFTKVDSIQISTKEDLLVADYNAAKNKLLLHNGESNSIYEYLIEKKVLRPVVLDNQKIKQFNNLGYYDDDRIIVTALNGYYIFNVNTKTEENFIGTDTTNTGGIWTRIRVFSVGGDKYFASVYKNTMDKETNRGYRNKRSYYESYKPITIYNESNKNFENALGYEKSSIFRKFDFYYPNRNILFDLNSKDSTLCIIHNPEQLLYTYKLDKLKALGAVIDLKPDYFKVVEKGIFEDYKKVDMDKSLMVNSNYRSLNIFDDYIVSTYDTGIPENIYNNMVNLTEYNGIARKYNLYYAQFFYKGNKICEDVKLPNQYRKICGFKSLSYILMEDALHSKNSKNILIVKLVAP